METEKIEKVHIEDVARIEGKEGTYEKVYILDIERHVDQEKPATLRLTILENGEETYRAEIKRRGIINEETGVLMNWIFTISLRSEKICVDNLVIKAFLLTMPIFSASIRELEEDLRKLGVKRIVEEVQKQLIKTIKQAIISYI